MTDLPLLQLLTHFLIVIDDEGEGTLINPPFLSEKKYYFLLSKHFF